MEGTEQDAAVDVGAALVSTPVVDVVGFAEEAGRSHPIHRQPPSRTASATRCFVVNSRCSRPTWSGSPISSTVTCWIPVLHRCFSPTQFGSVTPFSCNRVTGEPVPARYSSRFTTCTSLIPACLTPNTVSASATEPAFSTSRRRSWVSCSFVRGSFFSFAAAACSVAVTNLSARHDVAGVRCR